MLFVRVTESFEPACDLKVRLPDWSVIQTDQMPNGVTEMFFLADKTIFIDPSECGLPWVLAHITAHLDLGHHEDCADGFSDKQESEASWLAAMRMDYRPVKTLMKPTLPQQQLGFHALEFPIDGLPTIERDAV